MREKSLSLMAIALIGLLLITVTAACGVSEDEAVQAEIDIAGAPIDVRVTASRLAEDYEANEVAANQKYDGKVLEVSGTIEAVSGGGSGDAYYVDLSAGSMSLTSVRCHFSESHLGDITSIRKGERVTLRGKGDEGEDRDPFTIDVIGCSVIPEAPANTPTITNTTQPTPTAQSDAIPVVTVTSEFSPSSPASTPGTAQARAETTTPTPELTAVQTPEVAQTQASTPTSLPEPTPTRTPTATPTPEPTPTPTPRPMPPPSISGQGTDVRIVDLPVGEWVVEMSVSNDGDRDSISIQVGDSYVASVRADTWSGRSLIVVGSERSEIPPGNTAIEIDVAQEASWTLTFVDPPPTLASDETISGRGQDVKFVDLSAGEWVVEISISGNSSCSTVLGSCWDAYFTIEIGGDDVVFEDADTWSGKKLVAVGSAYDEIPPGRTPIEVEAESGATWTLKFIRQ